MTDPSSIFSAPATRGFVIWLTSLAISSSGAQQVTAVTTGPPCKTCHIALTRVATLVSSTFEIDVANPHMLRDNSGSFLVTGENGTSIARFGSDGAFIRKVGQKGDGVGQFRSIGAIAIGPGDSIHVFDTLLGRHVVIDSAFTRVVRSTPMPTRFGKAAVLPDHQVLFSGSVPTRQSAGLPLHLLDAQGHVVKSFGALDVSVAGGRNEQQRLFRSIAPGSNGGYWIAPATEYVIEWWNRDLKRERVLRRTVDWFPPISPSADFQSPLVDRPQTQLRSVWEGPSGLLFVNIGTAAADWRPTFAAMSDQVPIVRREDFHKFVDTIIEAIDSSTGAVLAHLRVPGILGQVGNGPYVWSIRAPTATGGVEVDVFRMGYVR